MAKWRKLMHTEFWRGILLVNVWKTEKHYNIKSDHKTIAVIEEDGWNWRRMVSSGRLWF
jgi:hypothetical protein